MTAGQELLQSACPASMRTEGIPSRWGGPAAERKRESVPIGTRAECEGDVRNGFEFAIVCRLLVKM